jgi:PAS domain S-box-containing protein
MSERTSPETLVMRDPVFERARVGMVVTDSEGRVLAANAEICRMLQMTAEEIVGHNFLIFVPRQDRGAARQSFEAVVSGGYLEQPDWHVRLRDGSMMWVRVVPSSYPMPNGETGILSVLTDVSSSRNGVAARQNAEHRARGFMDSNVIGVMEWGVDGRIIEVNDTLARLLGYEGRGQFPPELSWQQLTPADFATADRDAMQELMDTGNCQPYAKELTRLDGTRVPVLVACSRLSSENGRFVTYVLDRTERRMVEAALRESAETLRRVLDTALDSVVVLDSQGVIRDWRGSSEQFFGWSADEMVGQHFADRLLSPEAGAMLKDGLRRYCDSGDPSLVGSRTEWNLLRKDGSQVPAELSISAATYEGRTILCAFIHDLTERKRFESELEARVEERTAELQAAFEELESFSYSVAHDLRAPLRSINGFASLVISEYGEQLGEEGIGFLTRIVSASKRLGRLIDDLLGFARLARTQLQREPVDMTQLAHSVCAECALHWDHPAETIIHPALFARGDKDLLRLLLTNLIGNSFKFTSKTENPRIEIGRENGRFFVRDNGAGFDPQYSSRLFRAFERLHSNSDFEGTGIGLANVERIVRRHGGSVSAEGVPGGGATFYFTLG